MKNVTRQNLILRHNYLNDINHQIKFIRYKYVAQFYTTYTYTLILEGHICSFIYKDQIGTLFQDQSGMGISNLLACNTMWQLNCTTSTWSFVGELVVTPILLWLKFPRPYPTAYHSLARHVGWNVCSMNICVCFHNFVFRIVLPPLWCLVTCLSPDTFSEYVHGPRWDCAWDVSESGTTCSRDPLTRPFQIWHYIFAQRTLKHSFFCSSSYDILKLE